MKNYADESNPNCHTREDRNTAIQVAQYLGIQDFMIFDFRQAYEERIINYIYE
jgi:tRNA U34 2-thiouridine synthase MnmA/TrmU